MYTVHGIYITGVGVCTNDRRERPVSLNTPAVQQNGHALQLSTRLCRAAGGPRGACGAGCGAAEWTCVLRYASAELRADHEVVLAAVQQYGDALHAVRFCRSAGRLRDRAGCGAKAWRCAVLSLCRAEGGPRGCAGCGAASWICASLRLCRAAGGPQGRAGRGAAGWTCA